MGELNAHKHRRRKQKGALNRAPACDRPDPQSSTKKIRSAYPRSNTRIIEEIAQKTDGQEGVPSFSRVDPTIPPARRHKPPKTKPLRYALPVKSATMPPGQAAETTQHTGLGIATWADFLPACSPSSCASCRGAAVRALLPGLVCHHSS